MMSSTASTTTRRLGRCFRQSSRTSMPKAVKLAVGLSAEQRQGRVGDVIAKAYRKLIVQRMKTGQLAAAAKQCVEMFEAVPSEVQDVDRRRFNRILKHMDKAGKKHSYTPVDAANPASRPLFTVSKDAGWAVVGERELQGDERPDPAFDVVAMGGSGTWLLDRSGSSIAIMDSSGSLHIYDVALSVVTETNLQKDPRVVDHFRTIDTNYWGEFKSQIRAVDVAPEGDRYLFTLADEAWCCTMSGHTLWGAAMPLKAGWERVVRRTESFGAGHEVEEALRLFALCLPVSPIEIKQKYRALAMAHHPDRNPGNPEAEEKMKAVNRAFQVLTGVDPDTLGLEESEVTYFARTGPDYVVDLEGLRLEVTMTGGTPQDWVYAVSFAAADGCAFVATYSGKVILLSREGQPLVVYDLGTCPTEIVGVGRYTYFLTPTRLYVVEDRIKLAAFLDVFQKGRLLVSQSGFGLLSSKNLQWFTPSGTKVGELLTRDPIRTLHKTEGGAIVRTRRHHVEVQGPGL